MKLNITVNLADLSAQDYEDASLSEAIQGEIKREIIMYFKKDILEKFRADMLEYMKLQVIKEVTSDCLARAKRNVERGKFTVKSRYVEHKDITLDQLYFNEVVGKLSDKNKLEDFFEAQVKKTLENVQSRYDVNFAAKIISKMNDAGYLKEGVASAILAEGNHPTT